MSKQTRFPLSPPPHLSFFLFAFSPADATSQTFRIPRRTEELRFNAGQLHAHLELCDQTFTARPRASAGTLANARRHVGNAHKAALTHAAWQIPKSFDEFGVFFWRLSSSGPAAVISSVVLEGPLAASVQLWSFTLTSLAFILKYTQINHFSIISAASSSRTSVKAELCRGNLKQFSNLGQCKRNVSHFRLKS